MHRLLTWHSQPDFYNKESKQCPQAIARFRRVNIIIYKECCNSLQNLPSTHTLSMRLVSMEVLSNSTFCNWDT